MSTWFFVHFDPYSLSVVAFWFFQLVMAVLAVPVILASMKAYKIMAFTSAMEVDYAGVRKRLFFKTLMLVVLNQVSFT